ncbi:MAG: oxidoreductase, partial [Thiotrichaceae bacterium]
GISSVNCPTELKARLWQRLATDIKPRHIDKIVTSEIVFNQLPDWFEAYIRGEVSGRTVVKISD